MGLDSYKNIIPNLFNGLFWFWYSALGIITSKQRQYMYIYTWYISRLYCQLRDIIYIYIHIPGPLFYVRTWQKTLIFWSSFVFIVFPESGCFVVSIESRRSFYSWTESWRSWWIFLDDNRWKGWIILMLLQILCVSHTMHGTGMVYVPTWKVDFILVYLIYVGKYTVDESWVKTQWLKKGLIYWQDFFHQQ